MARYEECYAKLVLEHFFPERYCNLQIQDRPDLSTVDGTAGIEVTAAEDPFETAAQINAKISKGQVRNIMGSIQQVEKLGCVYSKWGITCEQEINRFYPLMDAIHKKIQKLNSGHYQQFEIYDLFIASGIEMDEETLIQALELLENTQSNNQYAFSRVYIASPWNLYELNTSTKQYFLHEFTGEIQCCLAKNALALLSKME